MFDESSWITQKVTVHISLTNMTHFTHPDARLVFTSSDVTHLHLPRSFLRSQKAANATKWK